MLRNLVVCLICAGFLICGVDRVNAESLKINKVLLHLLDKNGKHAKDPSLFERDRYQAVLRSDPTNCSTLRFDILWKNALSKSKETSIVGELVMVVEIRGSLSSDAPIVHQERVPNKRSLFSHWLKIKLPEEDFQKIGTVQAWRVYLRDDEKTITEYRSFMWDPTPQLELIK